MLSISQCTLAPLAGADLNDDLLVGVEQRLGPHERVIELVDVAGSDVEARIRPRAPAPAPPGPAGRARTGRDAVERIRKMRPAPCRLTGLKPGSGSGSCCCRAPRG